MMKKSKFTHILRYNVWECVEAIISAAKDFDIKLSDDLPQKKIDENNLVKLTAQDAIIIAKFWLEESTQKIFQRRNEFHVHDSCEYFMDNLERFSSEGFVPTEQDILRTRVMTLGISETHFTTDGVNFAIVDVGGQRSERKKWMHCFEKMAGVIFCVAISSYDQALQEDTTTNRMQESLKLFHEICQSKWFTTTAIILFLNKDDIFRAKIKAKKSISIAFSEYTGPTEYVPSMKFIKEKFLDVIDPCTGKPKEIYTHITCATDTTAIKIVFKAVKDTIVNAALKGSGLL